MSTTTTYARARLWTGISGVGTFVVVASFALALRLPQRVLAGVEPTLSAELAALAGALGVAALLALPFEILGGYVLPARFGRPHPTPARFATGWLRGVATVLLVTTASGVLLLQAGRLGGRPMAMAALLGVSLGLVALQEPLSRLVGGLRRAGRDLLRERGVDADGAIAIESSDPAFAGGFSGWRRPTIVIPARWVRRLDPGALRILLERRRRIVASGAWHRALVQAAAWNGAGFLLASFLPGGGVTSVAELTTTALGFTLWTFVGLLILPTASRRATLAMDTLVTATDGARAALADAVAFLDRSQDDEPERAPGVESIFHPVPSVQNRIAALGREVPAGAPAWNLARITLFLSHAGLSLLPRVVHCNAGRPELWVYLPTDG